MTTDAIENSAGFNVRPATDEERAAITEMLYDRDIDAFVAEDWSRVIDDFDAEAFVGYQGSHRGNGPWHVIFGRLEEYEANWLGDARAMIAGGADPARLTLELRASSRIAEIEVNGRFALVRKVFDGIVHVGEKRVVMDWTTNYLVRKDADRWRITGFMYLPPAGGAFSADGPAPGSKWVPGTASNHAASGPYSPVVVVPAGDIVAISGQGPQDASGTVIGDTIEEQTQLTLDNCRAKLAAAGCTFADVFKVSVFLRDLSEWGRFNDVYREAFADPRPVRTTAGVDLLLGMKVEIDMLARRPG